MRPLGRFRWLPLLAVTTAVVIAVSIALILVTGPNVPSAQPKWDYIVIGSGAGGATVAERLSRSGRYTVLVLEAGPDQDDNPLTSEVTNANLLYTAPYASQFFFGQLKTMPTTETLPPLVTSDWLYTGGRCLGGSTTINGMQYVRGTDWMRERWVNLTQDSIWNLSNALATFVTLEDYTGTTDEPSRRGTDGSLAVLEEFVTAPQSEPTSMSVKLVAAIQAATNLTPLVDYNDLTPEARVGPFTSWQLSAYANGTRCSSSRAFLPATVQARTNLRLLTRATVTRVNFDTGTTHASSVSYLLSGVSKTAYARRRQNDAASRVRRLGYTAEQIRD